MFRVQPFSSVTEGVNATYRETGASHGQNTRNSVQYWLQLYTTGYNCTQLCTIYTAKEYINYRKPFSRKPPFPSAEFFSIHY